MQHAGEDVHRQMDPQQGERRDGDGDGNRSLSGRVYDSGQDGNEEPHPERTDPEPDGECHVLKKPSALVEDRPAKRKRGHECRENREGDLPQREISTGCDPDDQTDAEGDRHPSLMCGM